MLCRMVREGRKFMTRKKAAQRLRKLKDQNPRMTAEEIISRAEEMGFNNHDARNVAAVVMGGWQLDNEF